MNFPTPLSCQMFWIIQVRKLTKRQKTVTPIFLNKGLYDTLFVFFHSVDKRQHKGNNQWSDRNSGVSHQVTEISAAEVFTIKSEEKEKRFGERETTRYHCTTRKHAQTSLVVRLTPLKGKQGVGEGGGNPGRKWVVLSSDPFPHFWRWKPVHAKRTCNVGQMHNPWSYSPSGSRLFVLFFCTKTLRNVGKMFVNSLVSRGNPASRRRLPAPLSYEFPPPAHAQHSNNEAAARRTFIYCTPIDSCSFSSDQMTSLTSTHWQRAPRHLPWQRWRMRVKRFAMLSFTHYLHFIRLRIRSARPQNIF